MCYCVFFCAANESLAGKSFPSFPYHGLYITTCDDGDDIKDTFMSF